MPQAMRASSFGVIGHITKLHIEMLMRLFWLNGGKQLEVHTTKSKFIQ